MKDWENKASMMVWGNADARTISVVNSCSLRVTPAVLMYDLMILVELRSLAREASSEIV